MINETALRNVIRALREIPDDRRESFNMERYGTSCGTPACCLGQYAFRTDLQALFILTSSGDIRYIETGRKIDFDDEPLLDHFGLTMTQTYVLFSTTGCGSAKTPEQAIAFIEAFIRGEHRGEV